ncbi:S8 family serine peptidase [Streptomyces sp. NPDC053560]|uniref:S8 family serine peptidase n=1 Tax=Streptomyces sp. NPDC053560 TaxID=3365711 RepID=UPI0037CED57E
MTMLNRRANAEGTSRPPRLWSTVLVVSCVLTMGLSGAAPAFAAEDVRSQQWYLDDMQAEAMWKVSTGKDVKVAVVDTGVNLSTPSLRGQVLPGKDVTGEPGDENDDYSGHGTTMAELIAGTGKGGGLRGLAPGAKIIPIRTVLKGMKVKGDDPDSFFRKITDAKAIRAAADSDAKIISMSFGGPGVSAEEWDATEYAAKKGKLLLAATGNEGQAGNKRNFPAGFPDVVGVASISDTGKVSKTSTHTEDTTLSAPGADVPGWCDAKFKSYCGGDGGTSSATAIASASAALIWSKHPEWNANQVLRVLIDTAGRKAKNEAASKYIGYGAVRPRMNLLEGKGDPGDPNQSPLFKKPKPTKPPSSGASEAAGSGGDTKPADKGKKARAAAETDGAGGGLLWGAVGAGAVVVVVAAGAFVVVRRRRA